MIASVVCVVLDSCETWGERGSGWGREENERKKKQRMSWMGSLKRVGQLHKGLIKLVP